MKLKGISKFEQHVEKYVLAGAAAALTGVVVWQLISPSKVKVGTNELSYSEMYEPLRVTAQQTKSRVEDPNPKLPEAPKVKLADAFQAQLQGKVVPREQLVAMGVPVTLDKGKSEPVSDSTFAIVVAPAPSEVHAHAFWSTVDPIEAASSADVAAVLPKTQPFDKSAVSVQIAFSGVDFRTALDTDPDGPEQPIQPVRRAWYRDLEIIGVELEREEEQPDGTFGNPVIVSSMPGRVSGLKIFTDTVKAAADVPSALAAIHAAGSEAVRPSYYDTLDGTPTWTEPNMVTESGEDQAAKDLKSLMAARQEAQKALDSINARLKAANAPQQGGNRENRGAGGGKNGGGNGRQPRQGRSHQEGRDYRAAHPQRQGSSGAA